MKIFKIKLFTFCFIFISCFSYIQAQSLSEEEMKLYNGLMEYRESKGLPNIPLSKSLTYVAQTHVQDLVYNKPDKKPCNPHSWSDKGKWSSCCYTDDHTKAKCMWDKPRELTSYTGDGYEIAAGSNDCCSDFKMTADVALEGWKNSPGHNSVIVNDGIWENQWNAIGVGLYKGFAVVWFGEEYD
ncbi:MAG: CAP domain-containing protein [Chitinophagaceae bacterium]|nr:MAG: CAP domain-containing protein [Chitinophagaceae bacterium]